MKSRLISFITLVIAIMAPAILKAQMPSKNECRQTLKQVCTELNKQCPQDLGEGDRMLGATIVDNTFTLKMSTKNTELISELESSSQEMAKQNVFDAMSNDEDNAAIMLVCAAAEYNFCISIQVPNGKTYKYTITPNEILSYY